MLKKCKRCVVSVGSVCLVVLMLNCVSAYANTTDGIESLKTQLTTLETKKEKIETMANCARELGISESSSTIKTAKELWVVTDSNISDLEQTIESLERQNKAKESMKKTLELNAFKITNLTSVEFDNMLKGTPLHGTGKSFEYIEKNDGINGVFAIAVTKIESSCGRYNANTNNFWGRRALGGGYLAFSTADDSIKSFGVYMSNNRYSGKSIESISKIYCPPNSINWANDVKLEMVNLWNNR